MDDRKSKIDFAKGFLEGIDAAFAEVEKLIARGHNNQELRVVVPTRKAAIKKEIERQMREQGLDIDQALEDRPKPRVELPRLKPGDRVMFMERSPSMSIDMLKRLVDDGAKALAIVRTDPEEFKSAVARDGLDVKWLVSEAPSTKTKQAAAMLGLAMDISEMPAKPQDTCIKAADMSGLVVTVNDFIKRDQRSVVYIEGLEYLVSVNGFPPVLKLVQLMREKTAACKGNLVLSMTPGAVEPKELALLEKEMAHVVPESAEKR